MNLDLRTKLLSLTVLACLVGMAGVVLVVPRLLRPPLYSDLERNLATQAGLLRRVYEDRAPQRASVPELQRLTRELSRESRLPITLYGPDGEALAGPEGPPGFRSFRQRSPAARMTGLGRGQGGYSRFQEKGRLSILMPVQPGESAPAVLQITASTENIERMVQWITGSVVGIMLLLSGGLLLLQYSFAQSMTWPIRLMTRTAQGIAEGDLRQRVRLRSLDEVGDLARAFNHMARNIDSQVNQLREAETTMRAAFAHMADGVVVLDDAARVLLINGVAESTFGMPGAQAQGRTLLDIALHPELDELVTQALNTGEQSSREIRLRRPSTRVLRVYVTPVPGSGDSLLGAVLVFQDLTEIRRLESIRRDFVTNASHELKTPLATIRVMVDTLKTGMAGEPNTARRFLETIGTEVQRLSALLDDLLDLSRIETGHFPLEFDVIALEPILKSLVETYRPAAEHRAQSLEIDLTCETLVWADPDALLRIASNLVENALKYTPEGGRIEVSCGTREKEAYFRVKDNGIGIPEADRERIFERFYRVDKARSRATGGTGLGLSILKHLVDAQGGRIEVESAVGRGSEFTVWLPTLREEDWREETLGDPDPEPIDDETSPVAPTPA